MKLRYALLLLLAGFAHADVTSMLTLPGGSNGSVQFDKSNRFAGDSNFTYSSSTHRLTVSSFTTPTATLSQISWPDGSVQTSAVYVTTSTSILGSTMTWTGQNAWTTPAPSSFTYGVVVGSLTITSQGLSVSTVTFTSATIRGITGSTITYSSATFTGVSGSTITFSSATFTGVSGSTLAYSSGTFTNLTAPTINGPSTLTSSTTLNSNVGIYGTLSATGSVTLGSAGNAVAISSNEFVGNTTFYAKGSNYSIVTDTMSAAQINNQIMRYRRPRLIYVSGTEVDIESGTVGGLTASGSSITVVFPDGAVYSSTGTEASQAVITSTANWGNPLSAGIRLGEKLTGNTWENYYFVKSSATGDTTHFVTVISSWQPTNANYQQLNTNFCGSGVINCWVYGGVVPYGDGASLPNAITKFATAGDWTVLQNPPTVSAATVPRGVRIADSASTSALAWTYASGTTVGSQVPAQLKIGSFSAIVTAGVIQTTDSGITTSYSMLNVTATNLIATDYAIEIQRGYRNFSASATGTTLTFCGYKDAALAGMDSL